MRTSFFNRVLKNATLNAFTPFVPGLGRESCVLYRDADREVIKRLEGVASQTEDVVDRIIVEAADACRPHAGRFGLEIQHLSDDT